MLKVISASLVALLMGILGQEPVELDQLELLSWEKAEIFVLPTEPEPAVEKIVQDYLKGLKAKGLVTKRQGVWIQSDWNEFAQNQGKVPGSAASLTKMATTLAVLAKWSPDYQFETRIYSTGLVKDGVLQGDLLVEGSSDPFFVWEEAIALGNTLNRLGIRKVTGNLVITGKFYLNYKSNPKVAGQRLKQGLNARLWSPVVTRAYRTLAPDLPRPQVAIAGTVVLKDNIPDSANLILRHQSLTVAEILKQMNIYSNNDLSEMLAQSVGGAKVVAQMAAKAAKVPQGEIQLINGSGLGVNNRISPRAACGILMAIERRLKSKSLNLADFFPVAGRDFQGTMLNRNIPSGVVLKTGTLNQVSALAGVIPTRDRGSVWFAIINYGNGIEYFRAQQDQLLQRLSQHWELTPISTTATNVHKGKLGDSSRNLSAEKFWIEDERG
ncbi:MAG: D-alanyl-D-alanine carboxypeptidase [Moorea sp. SIO2B7]|nr:D-alanyl-D-alanine carboxypeptidase [Moorena sp. SIO2B7]